MLLNTTSKEFNGNISNPYVNLFVDTLRFRSYTVTLSSVDAPTSESSLRLNTHD